MSVNEAAEMLVGKEATIVTVEGNEHRGVVKDLTYEDLVYQPNGSDSLVRMPLISLNRVETPIGSGRHMGAAFIGFMGGMAAGYFIGDATAPEHSAGGGWGWRIPRDAMHVGVIMTICGVGGCVGGGAVASSNPDFYEFPQEYAPADSVAKEKP